MNDFIYEPVRQKFKSRATECPICGKTFYVSSGQYMYKKQNKNGFTRYACGYTCYNKLCEAIEQSIKR